jgi:hypothetical protein
VSHENGPPPEAAIDSHAEEIPSEPGPLPPPAQAVALAPRAPAEREVLMPLDPAQVVEGMRQYQQLLRDLLEPSDWQTEDKNGNPLERPFLKKSGWRKIARAFNLSFERVHSRVERDEDGSPVRAEVWIRAVAPNGQYGDGDGYCSADEVRFKSWKGRQKLENDLRSTATTRAKNRATADLVGMGEVSAEEIAPASEDVDHVRALAAGAPASEELARVAFAALAQLLGRGEPDPTAARRVGERIAQDHGYLPVAVGRALCYAATALGAKRPGREAPESAHVAAPGATHAVADAPDAKSAADELAYWQRKGRYGDEVVRSLAALVCGEPAFDRLTQEQLGELGFLLECAVRGRVTRRSLEAWLTQLAERHDRRAAAKALRARLIEKTNEVELGGRRLDKYLALDRAQSGGRIVIVAMRLLIGPFTTVGRRSS